MDARELVNAARAKGQLTKAEADVLWCQNLTALQMARVLLSPKKYFRRGTSDTK